MLYSSLLLLTKPELFLSLLGYSYGRMSTDEFLYFLCGSSNRTHTTLIWKNKKHGLWIITFTGPYWELWHVDRNVISHFFFNLSQRWLVWMKIPVSALPCHIDEVRGLLDFIMKQKWYWVKKYFLAQKLRDEIFK